MFLDVGAVLAHGAGGAGDHKHAANAEPDAVVKQKTKNIVTASTDCEGSANTISTLIDFGYISSLSEVEPANQRPILNQFFRPKIR